MTSHSINEPNVTAFGSPQSCNLVILTFLSQVKMGGKNKRALAAILRPGSSGHKLPCASMFLSVSQLVQPLLAHSLEVHWRAECVVNDGLQVVALC